MDGGDGNLRVPFSTNATVFPQEIAGLMIRDYENPLVSLNKAGKKGPAISWGGPLRLP